MNAIISQTEVVTLGKDGSLTYKEGVTKDEWYETHRKFVHAKRYASAWLKKSCDLATELWGIEFMAQSQAQMEMDLEIEYKEKPQSINGPDKSGAYINIHGIATGFDIWARKIEDEVDAWDENQRATANELLEPMERKLRAIRERLGAGKAAAGAAQCMTTPR